MAELLQKDFLESLRAYAEIPDDEETQYKEKIRKTLLKCPELLYALHEENLETELFYENDNGENVLNMDEETGELLGEVDSYFGSSSNIRPYLFIPETQTEVKHYVCYKVEFSELPRYNDTLKYVDITFTIFVNGQDSIDTATGLPRHDLISAILKKKFNWSNIFGMQTHVISSKEGITDNNYITKTIVFQLVDTNGIVDTGKTGSTFINHRIRK